MFRSFSLALAIVLVGCAAGGKAGTESGGGDGGASNASSASGLSSVGANVSAGSGGNASACKHATYTSYAPGPDGVLGTADDVVTGSQEIWFMPGPQDFGFKAHPVKLLEKDVNGMPSLFERWAYD